MANGYWVIRTYTAGAVGEKIKYWVPGEKPTKSERKIKSDIKQVQRNEANAEKALARLIHANFTPRDYLLQFSYTEEALEKLQENPDTRVALLDIMLPGIDGRGGARASSHHRQRGGGGDRAGKVERGQHAPRASVRSGGPDASGPLSARAGAPPSEREEILAEPQPDRSAAEGSHRRFGRRAAGAAERSAAAKRRRRKRENKTHGTLAP